MFTKKTAAAVPPVKASKKKPATGVKPVWAGIADKMLGGKPGC